MSRLDGWRHRLGVLLRRASYDRERDEEIRFHLDLDAGQRTTAGAPPDVGAAAAARRRFGNVTYIAEEVRQMPGLTWLDALAHDLKLTLRTLRRAPAFTLAVVLTLAIGIGANTAIFSFVRGVLLRPLPFRDDGQLVALWTYLPKFGHEGASVPDYLDWKSKTSSFSAMGSFANTRFNLAVPNAEPERVGAAMADADFLPALGLTPARGRGFSAGDMVYGANHVVMLSDALWRRDFGADPDIVRRTITLNDVPYTVIGIAPPALRAIAPAELWVPESFDPSQPPRRRGDFLHVVGRLKSGVTIQHAQADASQLAEQLSKQYPNTNDGVGILVQPLRDVLIGSTRTPLVTFAAAVGLLFLIACANVANLMLARGTARRRELAVRVALGASRGRLMRQLLTESVFLACVGGACGMVVAYWGVHTLKAAVPADMPRLDSVRVDPAVFAFAFALAVVSGIAFGLMPAVRASSGAMQVQMAHGARGNASGGADRLRRGLVLAQTALALVLVVGAGLLARSFERLQQVNLGFNDRGVLTAQLLIPASRYPTSRQQLAFFERVRDDMRAVPGVRGAALTSDLPLVPNYSYLSFAVFGRPAPGKGERTPDAIFTVADSAYFGALGIPLVAGRGFTSADRDSTRNVVLLNDDAVKTYFGGVAPLGQRISFGNPADSTSWLTVVGVVGTTRLEGVGQDSYPQAFVPAAQLPQRAMYVVLRTAGDPLALLAPLRREVKSLDAGQPLADIASMSQRVATSVAPARLNSMLVAVFSLIALALAAVGIYGVVSYTVAQRTREIGIRLALGADAGDVMRFIVGRGMAPALVGVVVGLAGAIYAGHLARSLLFGVGAADPVSLIGAAVILTAIAAAACVLPGIRAMRVHPAIALAEE